jgi:hypothetical protein
MTSGAITAAARPETTGSSPMTKPAALTDFEMEYVKKCLDKQYQWFPNKLHLVAGLYAMACERNELLKEKAGAQAVNKSVYGC